MRETQGSKRTTIDGTNDLTSVPAQNRCHCVVVRICHSPPATTSVIFRRPSTDYLPCQVSPCASKSGPVRLDDLSDRHDLSCKLSAPEYSNRFNSFQPVFRLIPWARQSARILAPSVRQHDKLYRARSGDSPFKASQAPNCRLATIMRGVTQIYVWMPNRWRTY